MLMSVPVASADCAWSGMRKGGRFSARIPRLNSLEEIGADTGDTAHAPQPSMRCRMKRKKT
ncbi:hypothetical protein EMEDMD4_500107 [Sinorhizobium medicae]|uniref:Uncharacterized protein n=1 Tax=Sinorhizobium medicae TaxID=110321 RepID=A0A508X3P5_9HYPH|nr:hypothetical protein EMEDMD4_500107 [Sinorhizobium medicae]